MNRDLSGLAHREYDLLVIGGGIYGLCVARDAALRGLSVALLEKGDFGHATSSNTLRVIHGGLRYLQHGHFGRMRRSIRERTTFMRIAPHLIHPLPFLIPAYGHGRRGRGLLSLALLVNDLLGWGERSAADGHTCVPRGRIVSRAECLRIFPAVDDRGLTGGMIYYDAQMRSPERFILAVARSAVNAGAEIANYVEVTGFLTDGGHVRGVTARDVLSRDTLDVRARTVVNTGGPWVGRLMRLVDGRRGDAGPVLSKAFNLLVERPLVADCAVGVYGGGPRLFFIIPWFRRALIGTAHLPYGSDPDHLELTAWEIQAFLNDVNKACPAAAVKVEDVRLVYGGLLPVQETTGEDREVKLLRRPRIHDHQDDGLPGLISVIGVKFTEARVVAERTVDLIFRRLGKTSPPCLSALIPVHGGHVPDFEDVLTRQMRQGPDGVDAGTMRHLVYRYGSETSRVLKYLDADPLGPGAVSHAAAPNGAPWRVVRAEVLHGIQEEMAQRLSDVIFRRAELGVAGDPGQACVETCAAIMAHKLGWTPERTRSELEEVRAASSVRALGR